MADPFAMDAVDPFAMDADWPEDAFDDFPPRCDLSWSAFWVPFLSPKTVGNETAYH